MAEEEQQDVEQPEEAPAEDEAPEPQAAEEAPAPEAEPEPEPAEPIEEAPVAEAAEEAPEPQEAPEAEAAPEPEEAPAEEAAAVAEAPSRKPKRKRLPRSQRRQRTKPKREKPAERRPIVRLPKPEREAGRKQERRGVVVSSAMDRTIVVQVETVKAHPKYKKVVRRSRRFHAHDAENQANVGDVVRIVETRPLSKTKTWRLAEVVEQAK
jgi:small subunit ribosomal protein S17